jgi:astacin (peptidase family M12A)
MIVDTKNDNREPPQFCSLPFVPERSLSVGIDPRRESFIRRIEKTWVNGTKLTYCFFDESKGHNTPSDWTGLEEDKNVVREAFNTWKNVGIGLEFKEIEDPNEAIIRIGFKRRDGSWSYVGTDVLGIPRNQRTMNFGWSLSGTWYGEETAIHEIGHTLGAPHEHQNPNAGIEWNEDAVYAYFQGSPNYWDKNTIHHNILNSIPQREIEGSNWDPDSIMHYQFQAELINAPAPYDETGIYPEPGLSNDDKKWVGKFYPPLIEDNYIELIPFESHKATLQPGDQLDFIIKPSSSRKYVLQTFGDVDTLLVLFEKTANEEIYMEGDDDSGFDLNAKIIHRLIKGRTYLLRLRFYYSSEDGDTALMVW